MTLWTSVSGFLVSYGRFFGMAGCLAAMAAVVAPALAYKGRQGETYSALNHFISELGEVGISRFAVVFNVGLIVSGLALIPFLCGLGLTLGGVWGWLGMLAGLWASVSLLLVGVYPMNNLKPHGRAAMSYFRGGLVTILLFTLGIFLQPAGRAVITPWANLFGLLSAAAYASFLILTWRPSSKKDESNGLDPAEEPARPKFWMVPAVEWLVFASSIVWFFGVALLIKP